MPRIELYTLLDLVGDLSDSTEAGSASARFRKYLRENIQQVSDVRAYVSDALGRSSVVTTPKRKGHPSNLVPLASSYTGKTVRTVTFRNEQHEVHTWKEAAQVVFEALRDQDQQAFEHIALSLIGRKRPYITRNKEELRVPGSIPNTSLYFETNLSANMMIKLCHTLVDKMGYRKTDLVFETEE